MHAVKTNKDNPVVLLLRSLSEFDKNMDWIKSCENVCKIFLTP